MGRASQLFLASMLAAVVAVAIGGNFETDRAVLLEFKRGLIDATALDSDYSPTAQKLPWDPTTPPCFIDGANSWQWRGVKCEVVGGTLRVVELDLSASPSFYEDDSSDATLPGPLAGTLRSTLSKLDVLKRLRIRNNQLQGTLPGDLANPGSIESIWLSRNGHTGPLPEAWTNYTKLTSLQLDSNHLTSVPLSWTSMGLELLDLSKNALTGPLPMPIPWMKKLRVLSLSRNPSVDPNIPPSWVSPGTFPSLKYLDLSKCKLNGGLPETWGSVSMANLSTLNLAINNFTGTLPQTWVGNNTFQNLTALNLADNQLEGSLEIWGLSLAFPNLQNLTLIKNQFEGELPATWAMWSNLTNLVLSYNPGLFGSIPPAWGSLGNLPNLTELVLKPRTKLCGDVPEFLLTKVFRRGVYRRRPYTIGIDKAALTSLGPCY